MTKVIWVGDQREIPRRGVVSKGDEIELPDHEAKSFVYQGLANYPTTKKTQEKKS